MADVEVNTTSVLSEGDYTAFLNWVRSECPSGQWVFRGQSDTSFDLLPGVARGDQNVDPLSVEKLILDELNYYLSGVSSEKTSNDWESLALIQHYGAPTRLLDWSKSAPTALWFAVSNNVRKDAAPDAAVWACEVTEVDFISNEERETSSPLGVDRTCFFQTECPNERMNAQQGLFSCHKLWGSERHVPPSQITALNHDNNFRRKLKKLIIPGRFLKNLTVELEKAGVTAVSLFPDLVGLCIHLSMKHKLSPRTVYLSPLPIHAGAVGSATITSTKKDDVD